MVTAEDASGTRVGMTISSFNSVSMAPPLVLFSIARSALSLDAVLGATGYAVNVLGRDQQQLSDRFARSQTDKWRFVEHAMGKSGAPLLVGAIATFECVPYATHDGGDHIIFVARVMGFSEGKGEPLIFYEGGYQYLAATEAPLFAACSW